MRKTDLKEKEMEKCTGCGKMNHKKERDGMRVCELREKEVINVCNCKRLGNAVDIVFDACKGCVEAIVIPGPGKICGFLGSDSEYVIPFSCIKKIGEDIIFVEICEEKYLVPCK